MTYAETMPVRRPAWMNDELEALRASAREFYEREYVPHDDRWSRQQYVDRAAWNKAGAAGLLCASIPAAYGGGGGSFLHEAVINQEQYRAVSCGIANEVHSGIVAQYFLKFGTEEQRHSWLPRMGTGEYVSAMAMSEPGAGSDLRGMRTTARREGDYYVINGSKIFISNGHHADVICLAAKTDPDAGSRSISLIVLETKDLQGFRRGRILDKLGNKAQDTSELFFDDVRVPVANRLGAEGEGLSLMMRELPQERLLIAVQTIATMERAIELTVEFARQRGTGGAALIDMHDARFRLAQCKTQVHVARVFVDQCIELHMAGKLDTVKASMAKWWCTQIQCEVVDECLQLFGPYGYVLENPIARMYADVRVKKIVGGANEIMKEIIARSF
jgi:acyl-CoA dehydrogenase